MKRQSVTVIGAGVAGLAVAARGGLHQQAIDVAQVDGEAVVLYFGCIFDQCSRVQAFAHAAVEVFNILVAETVIQRQHRHRVGDLFKLRQRRRADTLGRRVRQRQLRVCLFKLLQLGNHWTNFALWQALKLTIKSLAFMAATIDREIKGDRP